MSGHSKWSTIKRKKGAADAKRSKAFSKIIKEITVAVKEGGSDPDGNPRLRLAISNAKGAHMPKENILRAINKGADKDAAAFVETTYEGYAPHGVAVFIEATTDNQQRTISNVRSIFNKYGGALSTNGSLSFIFDRKGIFEIPQEGVQDHDDFQMEVIDAGAEDIELEEGYFTITTAMEDFGAMMKKMEELKIQPESAELQRLPKTTVKLDKEAGLKVLKLIEIFEEDDDVQNVYHNLEMTDELMADM
ncbi:MAG TPA: YebC/PmpR family DNA-binding transcriptional regulator [Bacteroidales bacterium]|nr:YebC/PmpR family DNA-binding transcriptional regulator [Bacteroidales bacterium]HNS46615.1 YebC/PmpR family DNA-binding transcriptional regulator [Bacteroidales bacterium]